MQKSRIHLADHKSSTHPEFYSRADTADRNTNGVDRDQTEQKVQSDFRSALFPSLTYF